MEWAVFATVNSARKKDEATTSRVWNNYCERFPAAVLLFKDEKEPVTCLSSVVVSLFLYADEVRYAATCYVAMFSFEREDTVLLII
jgi:hypothetical protein